MESDLMLAGLAVALGLLACFFGYHFFRVVLSIGGFLLGAIILGSVAYNNGASEGITLAAGFMGGVVGLVLVTLAYYFNVFWLGAAWGASLTGIALGALQLPDTLITLALLIVGAVVGGMLGILIHDALIIVTTGIFGAAAVVLGAGALLMNDIEVLRQPLEAGITDTAYTVMFLGWIMLAIGGIVYQMRRLREASWDSR